MRYITVPLWVTEQLKLNGNEAIMYSLIFDATYNSKTEFYGSIEYMSKKLNISRNTTISVRDKLIKKELITKRIVIKDDVRHCYYKINNEALKNINMNYDVPLPATRPKKKTSLEVYNSFPQNKYDMEALEKEFLVN